MKKETQKPKGTVQTSGYLALARKYRPQAFADLIGQPHVTTTLSRAIEANRIGQAYLFTGQRGVGKTSAARILARCLNCHTGPTTTPCQQCPSCAAIRQGTSLDVVEIDGASNRGIDDIRQLREQVKLAPVHGRFRVYIIDEVHQITPDAFNALLKTLEEPPAHVKFIFATTVPQKIPATILSRCQRFDFRRLDSKTIVAALRRIAEAERLTVEEAALYAIARACDGSLRDAEVVLEQLSSFCDGPIGEADVTQLLGAVEQDGLVAWTQAILDRDASAALSLLAQQLNQGREVTQLLIGLLWHLRNLLVLRATATNSARREWLSQLVDVADDQRARLEAQAQQVSSEELLLMVQVLTGAYELARRSPFAQAILEFGLIKLTTRDSWVSLEQVVQRLEQLSQGPPARAGAPVSEARPSSAAGRAPAPVTMNEPTSRPAANRMASGPNAPPAAETVSVIAVQALWPKVLERIGQHKMSLAAYLADAKPLAVTGSRLEVGLPGFTLHQEVVTRAEHLRFVEQALGEVIGQSLTVDYTTLPEPPPESAANATSPAADQPGRAIAQPAVDEAAPPIVQDIVQLFNATIIPRRPAQP